MATPTAPVSAPSLSQKQRRSALRKERRKRKRRALAQSRESGVNDEVNQECEEDADDNEEDKTAEEEEEERQRLHETWLERERLAQEEFRQKMEREEAVRRRREEEERLIKEEWEARQRKEEEDQERKRQEKRDRETNFTNFSLTKMCTKSDMKTPDFYKDEAVQKRLDEAESQLENRGVWMNPEAPATDGSKNFGTERDVANCPFFLKTGACRFGDRCSRKHVYPSSSTTLLVRSMFFTFGMELAKRDDFDMDSCLEHSEEELHEHFIDFYRDVLPEFRSVGTVVQFKVSCNYESHLRGNVYVQFETEEQCQEALIKFNGRWYAGRQLHCELCPVTRWKNAICGLFDRQKCPKGKNCNFLHVFRNPGNEFWEADRDLSPDRRGRREGWHSERRGDRSWRQRSPPRSERSYREERWSEQRGSRSSSRRHDRGLNRSRSRSRDRSRRRSRSKDRSKASRMDKTSPARSKSRESTRRKRDRSPKVDEKTKSSPKDDDDDSPRKHHKHLKKSKKKSKKKHKKKSKESPKSTSEDSDEERTIPPPKTEGKEEVCVQTENADKDAIENIEPLENNGNNGEEQE